MSDPRNFFAEGELEASVADEKAKLLRMMAERGTEGVRVYNFARDRMARQSEVDSDDPREQARIVNVPEGLLRETARVVESGTRAASDAAALAQRSLAEANDAAATRESIYKDMVAGDGDLLSRLAQGAIDDSQRYGSGGGRGGRGGGGFSGFDTPSTIPAAAIDLWNTGSGIGTALQDAARQRRLGQEAASNAMHDPVDDAAGKARAMREQYGRDEERRRRSGGGRTRSVENAGTRTSDPLGTLVDRLAGL